MTLESAAPAPAAMPARDFALLTLSYALASIQFWMTVPLAALAMAERGVPAWQIGMVGAVPWLALVVVVPFVPGFAARVGIMPAYRLGIALAVAGALLFATAKGLVAWAVAYGLCGLGIAIRWIIVDSLITALAPAAHRGHRIGVFETVVGGTMALGPFILVVLGAGPAAYGAGVVLAAASIVPTFWLDLKTRLARAAPWHTLRAGIMRQPVATLLAVTAGLLEGAATKLLPVQAIGMGFGATLAAATVTAFGAGNLLTQYACGRLADRFGVARVTALALAVAGALALVLPALAQASTFYLGALTLMGGIIGALYTLAIIQAGSSGAAHEVMAVVAGISVSYTTGSVLGPLLGGAATSASIVWGLPLLIALTAGAAAMTFAAARGAQAGQRLLRLPGSNR